MSTELAQPGFSSLSQEPSRFDDKFDRIVKHYRCQLPDGHPQKVKLAKPLERQLEQWTTIHGLLSTGRYPKTYQQLNVILKTYPDITQRTARNLLADTKRFFAMTEQPNLAYSRMMLIEELSDAMNKAKKKNDFRSYAALAKVYADVTGANKTEEVIENRTVINVINYNPEQLGGQQISDDQLERMVERMLASDKKKQEELFDDFEDVSTTSKTQG